MNKTLKSFLEAVSQSETLQEKMNAIPKDLSREETVQRAVAIAAEAGFTLKNADFDTSNEALCEEELDAVTGGGGCGCVAAGGGGGTTGDGSTYGCACALYGQGGDAKNNNFQCGCCLGGGGVDGHREMTDPKKTW